MFFSKTSSLEGQGHIPAPAVGAHHTHAAPSTTQWPLIAHARARNQVLRLAPAVIGVGARRKTISPGLRVVDLLEALLHILAVIFGDPSGLPWKSIITPSPTNQSRGTSSMVQTRSHAVHGGAISGWGHPHGFRNGCTSGTRFRRRCPPADPQRCDPLKKPAICSAVSLWLQY